MIRKGQVGRFLSYVIMIALVFVVGVRVWGASEGANSPGATADDSAVGTLSWSNTGNATASDDSYATAGFGLGQKTTHYLKTASYSFAIPNDATVNGIVVDIERKRGCTFSDDDSHPRDNIVSLVQGGSVTGDNKADASTIWGSTDETVTYGGSSDLWGLSWTPAQINSSDFGAVLSGKFITGGGCFGSNDYSVDHISVTVYYTEAVVAVATGDAPSDDSPHSVTAGILDAGYLFSQVRAAGRVVSEEIDREKRKLVAEVQAGELARFLAKVPDADRVQEVTLKINSQVILLKGSKTESALFYTEQKLPSGTYPYTITADYGFTTFSAKGMLRVEHSRDDLIVAINRLFRQTFDREPTGNENAYWQQRIDDTPITTLGQLVGAMQWQKMFGT